MLFRVQLPIEVECPAGDLNTTVPARVDLAYHGGKWRAQCQQPPVMTVMCDSLEQALVAIAKAIAQDQQAAQPA
jgi:hypothetical protein